MSRRSRSSEESFSLFPFLAVLLCTMGTLTMIFVAVAKKGSDAPKWTEESERVVEFDPETGLGEMSQFGGVVDAKTLAESLDRNKLIKSRAKVSALEDIDAETESTIAPTSDDAYEQARERVGEMTLDDVLGEQESVEWFLEELRSVRERTETSLNAQRDRLAAAEAALERLRADLEVSQRKYETLFEEKESKSDEDAVALQDKINLLDVEIAELQREADKLREANKDAKQSYAIVPYQGKTGTFRRPIFIECNKDGVFLMPERVQFHYGDFLISKYPGNPFDVALRAVARNYVETSGERTENGDKIQPYPLLVVRPSGSESFYMALSALASWGDEYGYEFVDEDLKIEYPEPDMHLRLAITRQAAQARERLSAQLAAAYSAERAAEKAFSFNGATPGGGGQGGELQSRLGSNVRIGAAKVPESASGGASGGALASSQPNSGLGGGMPSGYPAGGTANPTGGANGASPIANDPLLATNAWQTVNQYGGGISSLANQPLPQYNGSYSQFVTSEPGGDAQGADGQSGGSALTGDANGDPNVGQGGGFNAGASDSLLATTGVGLNGVDGANGSYGADGSNGGSDAGSGSASGSNSGSGSSYAQGGTTQYVPNAGASSSANTPGFMANMVSQDGAQASADRPVDARQTLGNTTYAANAQGSAADGTLSQQSRQSDGDSGAADGMVSIEKRLDEDNTPKEAFRLSQEKPVTSGIERGILVRCNARNIEFPKQPGVRKATRIVMKNADPLSVEQELLDSVAFCIKSWGLAGRNSYWAPYLKVEVVEGGEERFRELSEFCERQGLSIVRIETNATTKQDGNDSRD